MACDDGEARAGRLTAAAAAGAIQLAFLAALLVGLAGRASLTEPKERVSAFTVQSPPPSPPPPQQRDAPRASEPEGRAGSALPREAPRPRIPLAPEPAATTAQSGSAAAEAPGSSGSGSGSGAGGDGNGEGSGGLASGPRRIAGQLTDRDYPPEAARVRAAGTVFVVLRIGSDGRVAGCTVDRSSGHAILDETTCRLATSRFRYAPARDSAGKAVPATVGTSFTWGPRS